MKNHEPPTARASITTYTSKTGRTLLKVRVRTPGDIHYRDYEHDPDTPLDAVVAAALRSTGVNAAWCWAALPKDRETPPAGLRAHRRQPEEN